MRRTGALLAAAAAAWLVALAGPVQAVEPEVDHQKYNLPGTDTEGEDGFCPFRVHVEVDTNQTPPKVTSYPDNSDVLEVQKYMGSAVMTVTGNGKTRQFKIRGPGTLTLFRDGGFELKVHGQHLLWTTVGNSFKDPETGDLEPQLAYTNGHLQVKVDADGLTTYYKVNGKVIDVCKLLAS